jgi:hypothetical protein
MKRIALYSVLSILLAIMFGFLTLAILRGDFGPETGLIAALPWGQMTLVDLYSGFIIFGLFVIWQEEHLYFAALWIALILLLGNIVSIIYLIKWLLFSSNARQQFK